MKKTLALFLIACLAFTMIPFGAFASTAASYDIWLTDDTGAFVDTVKTGDSIWASVALLDYESVGEADYATGVIDNAIAVVTTYLALDGFTVATDESGAPVWESAIAGITDNGSLAFNQDGDTAKFVLESDNEAGSAYAIGFTDLDDAVGELFKIKLNVTAESGEATVTPVQGDANGMASIATVTKAEGDAAFTVGELSVTGYDVPFAVAIEAAATPDQPSTPEVVEPGDYVLIDDLAGFTYADWTASLDIAGKGGTITPVADATAGKYTVQDDWNTNNGFNVAYNAAFDLSKGDFAFTGAIQPLGYNGNTIQNWSAAKPYTAIYAGVGVGGLEFRLMAANTPVITYNDVIIAAGESVVTPRYEMNADGSFVLDESGNPIESTVTVEAEDGTTTTEKVYADYAAYRKALEAAGILSVNLYYELKVEGTTVTGTVMKPDGTVKATVTGTLPEGALDGTLTPTVYLQGLTSYVDGYINGAKLVSDKLFATPVPTVISPTNVPFSSEDWVIDQGRTDASDTKYNVIVTDEYIQAGNGTFKAHYDANYTGDKFVLSVIADRRNGFGNDSGYGVGIELGGLMFALNNARTTAALYYNDEVIYQDDVIYYNHLNLDETTQATVDAYTSKYASNWADKFEGTNPTYTMSFDNGMVTVTYKDSKWEGTLIENFDASAYLTEVIDADIYLKNKKGNYDAYDIYRGVALAYGVEPIDIGYANAVVGSMADYADYDNYPAVFNDLKAAINHCSADYAKYITNADIVTAYDNEYKAYNELGTVTLDAGYFLNGFVKDDWTKVSDHTDNGGDGYQSHRFKTHASVPNYLEHEGTEAVSSAGTFALGNEWHLEFAGFGAQYNNGAGQYFAWNIGAYTVKIDISTGYAHAVSILNGETVLATSESYSIATASSCGEIGAMFVAAFGDARGGIYNIDYVNGTLSVSYNGTVVASAALEGADFSAAEVQFASAIGWRVHRFYNLTLAGAPEVINLYNFNIELGTLADADLSAGYSDLAAKADIIIPQLTAEQEYAMYNIPVYEQYKADYDYYLANQEVVAAGATYKYTSGLYKSEWASTTVEDANYKRDVAKEVTEDITEEQQVPVVDENGEPVLDENGEPTYTTEKVVVGTNTYTQYLYQNGAISFPGDAKTRTITFKYPFFSEEYVNFAFEPGTSGRDHSVALKLGDLKLIFAADGNGTVYGTDSNSRIVLYAYMGDTLLTEYAIPNMDKWSYSGPWNVIYDNGTVKMLRYNNQYGEIVDLTTCEGWNADYTVNGNIPEIEFVTNWTGWTFSKMSITGKVNAAAVEGIEYLVANDLSTAKNIYATTGGKADKFFSAEALEALAANASVTAENATIAISPLKPIYGEEVTAVATPAEGYVVRGWYDAEGNLLVEGDTLTGVYTPNTVVVAKAFVDPATCEHVNLEVRGEIKATCTTEGNTGEIWCLDCETKIEDGTVIEALDHTIEVIPGTAATCTEPGLTDGEKCTVCGEIITEQVEIPAAHTIEVIPGTAATCTESGLTDGEKCSVCGEVITEQTEIAPLGHTEEVIPGKAATCGEAGYTESVKCSVCGEVITAAEAIPATGEHTYGDWVVAEDGKSQSKTCSVCGDVVTEEIEVTDPEITTSGNWNDDGSITWGFDENTGILYINGTGEMRAYGMRKSPVLHLSEVVKEIVIGEGITAIGNRAFRDMPALETVTLGKDVVTMGYEAFTYCPNLTTVNLNEGLESIGSCAFYGCGLTEITIPSTVNTLNNRAFKDCANLKYIDIPDTVTYVGYEVFMNNTSLTNFRWTAGASYINAVMFSGCTALTEVSIPQTVYSIKSNAFANCTGLAVIDFENSDYLYADAFASDTFVGCNSTMVIKAYSGTPAQTVCYNKGFVFEAKNDSNFKYTVGSDDTVTITGIREVSASLSIPTTINGKTVTAIGNNAFRNKTQITTVSIPEGIKSIGGRAFAGTSISYVIIPASVDTIQYQAFENCLSLQSVTFNGTAVTLINTGAFRGCSALTTVKNFEKLSTKIGSQVFANCTALGTLRIGKGVTSISGDAFSGCTALTIECWEGTTAHTTAVNKGIAYKVLTDFNYTVNADGTTITVTEYLGEGGAVVIPETIDGYTVTTVGARLFRNNTAVTSIDIPATVTTINYEVIKGASNVTDVYIRNASASINNVALTSSGNDALVIHGYAGSTAQTYATSKGITFAEIAE